MNLCAEKAHKKAARRRAGGRGGETMEKRMCKIPVFAKIVVDKDKHAEVVDAQYKEIDPDVIARFLIRKFGASAIFDGPKPKKA